jgi:hypothetical protein
MIFSCYELSQTGCLASKDEEQAMSLTFFQKPIESLIDLSLMVHDSRKL